MGTVAFFPPLAQPVDGANGRGDFGGRPFALHADGHHEHVGPAPAAAQHLQKIVDGRPGGAGHQRDVADKGRQRPLAGGVEEPFAGELLAELPQGQFERPDALGHHVLDHQLVVPAGRVEVEVPPADDLQAVVRREPQPGRRAPPHDRAELSPLVLERQIAMPRLRPDEVRYLARHPDLRERRLHQVLDLRAKAPRPTAGGERKALARRANTRP